MLCEDMGNLHTSLLLHTEVRWLSRGKTLTQLFEMKPEVRIFLIDDDFALGDRLCEERWLMKLAYLADIFKKLNDLSLSLQGKAVTVFEASNKVQAFKKENQVLGGINEKSNSRQLPNGKRIHRRTYLEMS